MNSHIPGPAALINNCSIGGDVNQQVTHNVNFRQDPPESQKSPTPPAQVYNYCRRLSPRRLKGSLLRAFVLDVSDQVVMKSLFSAQEVETIKSAFPSMPQLEKKFLEMLDRFVDVESIRDLRCRLYGVVPRSPDACVDDRKMVEWIEQVYWNTLYLFDCEKKPLTSNHNEQWFNSNIWSRVIDTLFLSLPSVDNLRSEVVCVATSILANSNRTDTGGPDNRRKLGPRLDGIFRMKNGDKFEVGAIEVSKSFDSTTSTKWIHDSKKLRFALRDMLLRLHDIVDTCGDDGVIERLQTVGILNAGLKFQLVRCWAKRKGGVVLCKASELLEFPTSIEQIAHLGTLLQAMAIVKKIVEAVNKEVEQRVLQNDRPAIRRTTVPAKIDT
ncbi:hypothetical protein EX30DRAFT_196486 [Ascodesmis nigricans]|uniref:Uncharacterized protein n=1 Tax=Ascodesmis nigricans TaxID=341454 RepID=A0A4S2MKL9_9PEZI|nr:hypothetical protein EX30DRAFT_196486 [Ascodesmis nigricans]